MTSPVDQDAFSETLRQAWQQDATRRLVLRDGQSSLLRPLTPADASLIAEFFATLSNREIFYFFSLEECTARHLAENVLVDPAMRLIALAEHENGEHIIGYMFLDWAGDLSPSFGACLKEEAQSQGLGGAMMEHFLTRARAAGVAHVHLTAHAENWRALRLYQRLGFQITDEFILQAQGARQYRMRIDLRQARPEILDQLIIVARGGIGVGLAARSIQASLEPLLGARPLILDRPTRADSYTIIVSDLAATPEHPFETPVPAFPRDQSGVGWVTSLDARTVLIAGFGSSAVSRAAVRYIEAVTDRVSAARGAMLTLETLPFDGLTMQC